MDFIKTELARPLARRFGTFIAGMATALGVTVADASTVETAVTALAMVGIDLILSYWARKR